MGVNDDCERECVSFCTKFPSTYCLPFISMGGIAIGLHHWCSCPGVTSMQRLLITSATKIFSMQLSEICWQIQFVPFYFPVVCVTQDAENQIGRKKSQNEMKK